MILGMRLLRAFVSDEIPSVKVPACKFSIFSESLILASQSVTN